MRVLEGVEREEASRYMEEAIKSASNSTCKDARCGTVIVKDSEIIGRGFNSPPGDIDSQRRCSGTKDSYHKRVTDKTCCIHAEQRAIMDALRKNHDRLKGSKLYFIRINAEGKRTFAGKPFCTICSKMALDAGVKEFLLWPENGICSYETEEYNDISFKYK